MIRGHISQVPGPGLSEVRRGGRHLGIAGLSVLEATVALVEDPDLWPEVVDIAARSGLAVEDVAGPLRAIDGEYVDTQIAWSWHGGQEGMTDGHG
jgi:hypothetical protein